MRIFLTGATGYIGGSVAAALIAAGHDVRGLVRDEARGSALAARGIEPVTGSLDDAALLTGEARGADAVVDAASADHRASAEALLAGISGTGRVFLRTSGSSVVGHPDAGEYRAEIYDEEAPFTPSEGRAARVALDRDVLAASERGVRPVIICPSLIYGKGHGLNEDSVQVPWLLNLAKKKGRALHIGPGTNVWSNVYIDDLVDLYLRALDRAPAGAFYFAENGEMSMRDMCAAIAEAHGLGGPEPMTLDEAAAEWGAGPAANTMGSNSRVRAVRARKELGWAPTGPSLADEIARGCYAA